MALTLPELAASELAARVRKGLDQALGDRTASRPPSAPIEGASIGGAQIESTSSESSSAGALVDNKLARRLFAHYSALAEWAPRINLIGPGAVLELIPRHYVESLLALPWLASWARSGQTLVDIGSGAGFPGLVLAAAMPELATTLVESRGKKAAFLRAAARRMDLRVDVLAARIGPKLPAELPARIDFLTLRAVRLDESIWRKLIGRLRPCGRALLWTTEVPEEALRWLEEEESMACGQRRRLVVLRTKDRKLVP